MCFAEELLEVTEWIDGGASGEGGGRQWKLRNAMFDVVLLASAVSAAMAVLSLKGDLTRTGARPNAQYDLSQNGCNMKCSDRGGANEEP